MPSAPFPVYSLDLGVLTASSLGVVEARFTEQMGSKEKFWLRLGSGTRLLVKYARARTGEHWSEKVAAEVANLLGVPCAQVELGICNNRPVSISFSILRPGESLVHGNELLNELDPTYPIDQNYRAIQHTVTAIRDVLTSLDVAAPDQTRSFVPSPFATFAGYLLLDALIGNTDRHHENWGVVLRRGGERQLVLAPSYDHASSLGRELEDDKRAARLAAKDRRAGVAGYAARATSALYGAGDGHRKPLSCIEAFECACQLDPAGSSWWRERLHATRPEQLEEIVRRVPLSQMSQPASEFAIALLNHNLHELQSRFR